MNTSNLIIKKVKALIAKNYCEEALEVLMVFLENHPFNKVLCNDLILLSSQFADIKRRDALMLGIKKEEKSRFINGLLFFLNKMEELDQIFYSEEELILLLQNIKLELNKSRKTAFKVIVRSSITVITCYSITIVFLGVNIYSVIILVVITILFGGFLYVKDFSILGLFDIEPLE
ncbi:MAG: hypothetical protein R2824_32215 [Saprospiraceae bacterium]|nr:hypothetical protein [Lewinella sp.]